MHSRTHTRLDQLPAEILLRIINYLGPADTAKFVKVNKICSTLAPDACKRSCFFTLAAKAGKLNLVEQFFACTTAEQRRGAVVGAAGNGHTCVLQFLLPKIAEQQETTQQILYVALRDAALRGKAEAVDCILAHPEAEWARELVLDAAVEGGSTECVQSILSKGAAMLPARCKDSALHRAVVNGNARMADALIADGTNEIARQNTLWAAVCLYSHPHEARVAIVCSLLQSLTQFPEPQNIALIRAASYGHLEYTQAILAMDRVSSYSDAMVAAAVNGHSKVVDALLDSGKVSPADGFYAGLVGAAANGYADVVRQLLVAMNTKMKRHTRSSRQLIEAAQEGALDQFMKIAGGSRGRLVRATITSRLWQKGARLMTWSEDDVEEMADTLVLASADLDT